MILLLKLLLAHLIGDFILQPAGWVKAKEEKKLKSWQLYAHTLVHGVLIILLTWDIYFLWAAIGIMISHGLIDAGKVMLQKESNKRLWFALDQFLHLAVLASVWMLIENPALDIALSRKDILIITAVTLITTPTSVVIKMLISQWVPTPGTNNDSLQNAGKFIGILERLMVFTFALTNNWEAIGFLIAAKSVFRFGDLKDSKDLQLTEYVLIGTLLSFGVAIAAGLLVTYLA
jgi:hypothetical protein